MPSGRAHDQDEDLSTGEEPAVENTVIRVEVTKCIGAGNCAEVAPDYFDQDQDDGTVVVRKPHVDPADEADVDEAVHACPVRAIARS